MSKIAVIGTGYVGLTTGACFAHIGHDVVCADIDADKVARLQRGEIPILEAGPRQPRAGRARRTVGSRSCSAPQHAVRRLRVRLPLRAHARRAPTARPTSPTSRTPPAEIGPLLPTRGRRGQQVHRAGRLHPGRRAGARPQPTSPSCRTPSSSARARPIHDFLHPDRIVIGAEDQSAAVKVAVALPRHHRAGHRHRPGVGRDDQVRRQRLPRHEDLLHQRGRRGVRGGRRRHQGRRPRHGLRHPHRPRVPQARPGLGRVAASRRTRGRWCASPRTPATTSTCSRAWSPSTTSSSTASPPRSSTLAGGSVEGKRIAVWGLTFKARTDDLRESPSLSVIAHLVGPGRRGPGLRPVRTAARSRASRSSTIPTPPSRAPRCSPCSPSGTSSAGSTSTRWPTSWRAKNVVDARNLLDRAALARRGFEYRGHRAQLSAERVRSRRAPRPRATTTSPSSRSTSRAPGPTRWCSSAGGSRRSSPTSPSDEWRHPSRCDGWTRAGRRHPPGQHQRLLGPVDPGQALAGEPTRFLGVVRSGGVTRPAGRQRAGHAARATPSSSVPRQQRGDARRRSRRSTTPDWDARGRGAARATCPCGSSPTTPCGTAGCTSATSSLPLGRAAGRGRRRGAHLPALRRRPRAGVRGRRRAAAPGGTAVLEVTDPDARIVVSADADQVRVARRRRARRTRRSRAWRAVAAARDAQPARRRRTGARRRVGWLDRRARRRVRPGRRRPTSRAPPGSAVEHAVEGGERGRVAVGRLEGRPGRARGRASSVGAASRTAATTPVDVAVAEAAADAEARDGLVDVAPLGPDVQHGRPAARLACSFDGLITPRQRSSSVMSARSAPAITAGVSSLGT